MNSPIAAAALRLAQTPDVSASGTSGRESRRPRWWSAAGLAWSAIVVRAAAIPSE
jgi:hypothetical protein